MNTSQCTYQSRNKLENTYITYKDGSYKYYNIDGTAFYHDGRSRSNFFMGECGMYFFFQDVDGWRLDCWGAEKFRDLLDSKSLRLGQIFEEMLHIQAKKKKQRVDKLHSVMSSTNTHLALCH
ncbi:uncharacterized protein LOC130648954 [Hydractinia symbiolongicarpus]|uniref:uncharacterized protein LOC130648954 n=1 Tax=Hydractinia symbiolongicarpus TaxID=13093 RepID=UPI00254ECCA8|nr:uncharacterized protein LOC130648954 [Hydractinia symbiolongicarpus]